MPRDHDPQAAWLDIIEARVPRSGLKGVLHRGGRVARPPAMGPPSSSCRPMGTRPEAFSLLGQECLLG